MGRSKHKRTDNIQQSVLSKDDKFPNFPGFPVYEIFDGWKYSWLSELRVQESRIREEIYKRNFMKGNE